MNAKIFKDGNRIIVSFEGIDDAEDFLQRVVKVVSDAAMLEEPQAEITDLEPPVESKETFEELFSDTENLEPSLVSETAHEEPKEEDFTEPFSGQKPSDILAAPNFEGFYFLCQAVRENRVPACYQAEVFNLLGDFIRKKQILKPPFGNVSRMQNYCKMAQRMLGKKDVPDEAFACDDEEWLDSSCQAAFELIQAFYDSLKS